MKFSDAVVDMACQAAYNEMDMGTFPGDAVDPRADRDFIRAALKAALPMVVGEAAGEVTREGEGYIAARVYGYLSPGTKLYTLTTLEAKGSTAAEQLKENPNE